MLVHYIEQTSAGNMEADNLRRAANYQHFDKKGLDSLPVMLEEEEQVYLQLLRQMMILALRHCGC